MLSASGRLFSPLQNKPVRSGHVLATEDLFLVLLLRSLGLIPRHLRRGFLFCGIFDILAGYRFFRTRPLKLRQIETVRLPTGAKC